MHSPAISCSGEEPTLKHQPLAQPTSATLYYVFPCTTQEMRKEQNSNAAAGGESVTGSIHLGSLIPKPRSAQPACSYLFLPWAGTWSPGILSWHSSCALGHILQGLWREGFTLTGRQHRAASWAQTCVFTEVPRCAKQLARRSLQPVHACRAGKLGAAGKALLQAEPVQLGVPARAPAQTCTAAAAGGAELLSHCGCPSTRAHSRPC